MQRLAVWVGRVLVALVVVVLVVIGEQAGRRTDLRAARVQHAVCHDEGVARVLLQLFVGLDRDHPAGRIPDGLVDADYRHWLPAMRPSPPLTASVDVRVANLDEEHGLAGDGARIDVAVERAP